MKEKKEFDFPRQPPYLSLFSSSWYSLSHESGTFWVLQGRLLLLLTLFLRVKLFLRTDWLLFSTLLVVVLFPDTQLVNCFRGAPSDMKESILRVLLSSVVNQVKFSQGLCHKLGVLSANTNK